MVCTLSVAMPDPVATPREQRSGRFVGRVLSGYVTVIVLLAVPAAIAIGNAWVAAQIRDHLTARQVARVQRADELGRTEAALTTSVWTFRPEAVEEAKAAFLQSLADLSGDGEGDVVGEAMVEQIRLEAGDYLAVLDRLLTAQSLGTGEETRSLFNEVVLPRHRALVRALEAYVAHQSSLVEPVRARADRAFLAMLVVPAAAFVLGAVASVWFSRRSLGELRALYEREQAATARAEKAVADRDELQRILAHDLRNSLNAISLKAHLLALTTPSGEASDRARSLDADIDRMAELMQAMLDTGRIQDGRFLVSPEELDAGSVLAEAADLFRVQLGSRSLELRLPQDREQLMVYAERGRVLQALGNLLSNAIRHTPETGAITVTAETEPGGEWLRLTIADSGNGVDPELAPQLFDRYVTGGDGPSSTGLGLYITKAIVEAHGGRIWLESAPDGGAVFCFTLPRAGREDRGVRAGEGPRALRAS